MITENKSEIHLIILWANARYKEKEILEDIESKLEIVDCFDIKWSKEKVANNFSRFYGCKLDNNSFKEKECGTGAFLLVIVKDNKPVYDFIETSRGHEYINKNIFELKTKYRNWTGGGHKIHTTNTTDETNHDLTLLLGKNLGDYTSTINKEWDKNIKFLSRDLTGAHGWKNLKEFFYVLNATTKYVVLRNYEILPDSFKSDLHGDIDILCENYKDMQFISNSTPVFNEKYRIHNKVKIDSEEVFFDFRHIGDSYYCLEFENDIIHERILNKNGFYIPNNKHYFYSLIYHALIHKNIIAKDYYTKIFNLYRMNKFEEGEFKKYKFPFDLYFKMLIEYMKKYNYTFEKPCDNSVFYNESIIKINNGISHLENRYKLKNIEPYLVNLCNNNSSFYVGYTKEKKKVFIKTTNMEYITKNEYEIQNILYSKNPINFVKPYYYEGNEKCQNIITGYIDGESLNSFIDNNQLTKEIKYKFKIHLENIAKTLLDTKIVHRDIIPRNILVTKDFKLVLIDSAYGVSYENYKELPVILKNPKKFYALGEEYAKGKYIWDDLYSLNKICEMLDINSDFIKENIGKQEIKLQEMQTYAFGQEIKLQEKQTCTFLQKIFSVKNDTGKIHKVITVLGIEIRFKQKKK